MSYGTPTPTPEEATRGSLAERFNGRTVSDGGRAVTDTTCNRCARKNTFRVRYGDATWRDVPSSALEPGDRITFAAVYEPNKDGFYLPDGPFWQITGYYHAEHNHAPPEKFVSEDTPFLYGKASLVPIESAPVVDLHPEQSPRDGEAVLADVTIDSYLPPGVGGSGEAADELQRNSAPVVVKTPEKPASWPEAEYDWLNLLIQETGSNE